MPSLTGQGPHEVFVRTLSCVWRVCARLSVCVVVFHLFTGPASTPSDQEDERCSQSEGTEGTADGPAAEV